MYVAEDVVLRFDLLLHHREQLHAAGPHTADGQITVTLAHSHTVTAAVSHSPAPDNRRQGLRTTIITTSTSNNVDMSVTGRRSQTDPSRLTLHRLLRSPSPRLGHPAYPVTYSVRTAVTYRPTDISPDLSQSAVATSRVSDAAQRQMITEAKHVEWLSSPRK